MREIAISWYQILNTLFVSLGAPLRDIAGGASASLVTAAFLGVLGATSPCQLSTNASAIAYLGLSGNGPRSRIAWSTVAYVLGKALVYSVVGLLAVFMKESLQSAAIPVVVVTRKALGPLMILMGLAMLELWRPRLSIGHKFSLRLRERAGAESVIGAFALGIAFSFAFCPTLGLLFFGYVMPMAIASAAGPLYPAMFAIGTTFPLMVTAVLLATGAGTTRLGDRLSSWEPWIRRGAGAIFLLAGVNDTLLYWFL